MDWIKPAAIFDGFDFDTKLALGVENEVVTELCDIAELPDAAAVRTTDSIWSVGLFDVQVNGGGGVMLNNEPTPEGVQKIAAAHRSVGTAFTLPTVITDRFEVTEKAAFAVLQEHGKNGVTGIHIEGPHISTARSGIHLPQYIRPLDEQMFALLEKLRNQELPVLLTLAPECVSAGSIAQLRRMGVVVSAGHSAATADQTEAALAEGLSCFTHLFNGMPGMTSREPGIVGAAINSDVWCGIIADGLHVDYRMMALAIRARPVADRMILVSDAMSTIGGPDRFEIYGEVVRLKKDRLVNAAGSLAGAHIDLKNSVANVIANTAVPATTTLRMATTNPRQMMGLKPQSLKGSRLTEMTEFSPRAFPDF